MRGILRLMKWKSKDKINCCFPYCLGGIDRDWMIKSRFCEGDYQSYIYGLEKFKSLCVSLFELTYWISNC